MFNFKFRVMKNLLFLFVISISLSVYSQSIPTKTFNELEVNALECKIEVMKLDANNDISNEYGSGVDMTKHLITHLDTLKSSDLSYKFLKSYQENLDVVLHNFGTGSKDNVLFIRTDSNFPVIISKYKNGANMLIISNMLSPNVYNTLQLSSRERAYKVISDIIIELSSTLSRYDYNPPVKYIGCGVCYCIDDFSNRRTIGVNLEFVFTIFPIQLLKQYRNGQISEEKLLSNSDIFISENGKHDLKKIEVQIQ